MTNPLSRTLLLLGMLLFVGAQHSPPAADDPGPPQPGQFPRPASTYRGRTDAGLPARLDYYDDTAPFVIFSVEASADPAKPEPSLADEGQTLDRLLAQLLSGQPRPPSRFRFATDTRPLVAALNARLVRPGANWDPQAGKPRHGVPRQVLQSELADVLATSPIEAAFQSHGYHLILDGISRIEFPPRRVPVQVPRLISGMDITATRTEADHGATQ